jgi:hypothetical protein
MRRTSWFSGFIRARVPASALLLATLALLAACSGGGSSAPSSTALLATAATKLSSDTAFHFTVTEDHPGTPSGTNTDITKAVGDVVNPDKLSATATVNTAFGSIDNNQLIVVGDHAWIKGLATGGQWQSDDDPAYINIGTFFTNVHNGLPAIVKSNVQNVSAPSDGSANGVSSWKITATISSDYLAALTGGQVTGGQQIGVTLWVSKNDGRLQQVAIPGKLISYDTAQTSRTIILSNFNESLTITPPPGA